MVEEVPKLRCFCEQITFRALVFFPVALWPPAEWQGRPHIQYFSHCTRLAIVPFRVCDQQNVRLSPIWQWDISRCN